MLNHTEEYKTLENLALKYGSQHLREAFGEDPKRFETFSFKTPSLKLLADFSRQRINGEILDALLALARRQGVEEARDAMFNGDKLNNTENRAVLHTALRGSCRRDLMLNGINVTDAVEQEQTRFLQFAEDIRDGRFVSANGKPFTDIVNIGIGGSDLGPKMAYEALLHYVNGPKVHFVSNVDGTHLSETLKQVNLKTTLFLIASKTFTTQETMTNAQSARTTVVHALGEDAVSQHFAAMSTNLDAVTNFGIPAEQVFGFWDFIGGRYSMFSSIGLPLAIALGRQQFLQMLAGARKLDEHFLNTPLEDNIPVLMALVGIWNVNFLDFHSLAILPYEQYLHRFAAHFQQVDMESNGKSVRKNGSPVDYQTGPILWGEPGTNGQHAFYQLLHQGTSIIPADFIGFRHSNNPTGQHHRILMSHFLAQTEALAMGKTLAEVVQELKGQGHSNSEIQRLTPHKIFEGNRPTTTLLLDRLTPESLGILIALYEQKIFVQGTVWDVNSFDQMGVELGKVLAGRILKELNGTETFEHDSATTGLINELLNDGFDG